MCVPYACWIVHVYIKSYFYYGAPATIDRQQTPDSLTGDLTRIVRILKENFPKLDFGSVVSLVWSREGTWPWLFASWWQ